VEAVRKYGKECVTLINHDISSQVEDEDIKRFKREAAEYIGLPLTYANAKDFQTLTPIKVALSLGCFQFQTGKAFCTKVLKTLPFMDYLKRNCKLKEDYCIIYGFDADETERINRRSTFMHSMGYKTEYPLAKWERTIANIEEIGIKRPNIYQRFKHANCIGCLKAGKQHWYAVYCLRRDIFEEVKQAEEMIGYSIINGAYLRDLEPLYNEMLNVKQICPNDNTPQQTFWARVEKVMPEQITLFPCDCLI
jgi:hypothetical protein